jgi:membrane protein
MKSLFRAISRFNRWITRSFMGLTGLVQATAGRAMAANVPALSAALAFHALLSLAPLLLLLLTALSSILGSHDARARLVGAIQSIGDPTLAAPLRSTVEMIMNTRGSKLANVAGVLVMVYFSSAVFHELGAALDRIWDVQPRPGIGGLLVQRLIALVIVPLAVAAGMALMAFSFMHALIAPILSQLLPPNAPAWALSRGLVLSVLMALLLSLLYRYGPRAPVRWREAAVGASLTALTFTAGNTALATMLRRNMLASLYGAAGAIVLLLLWIFYSAHILLIGACFTRELGLLFAPKAAEAAASDVRAR